MARSSAGGGSAGSRLRKALRALPLAFTGPGPAGLPGSPGAGRKASPTPREAPAGSFPAPEAQVGPVEWGRGRFRYSELPAYADLAPGRGGKRPCSVTVHGGVPFFSEEDFEGDRCWGVRDRDGLKRARCAYVLVGPDTVHDRADRPPNSKLPNPTGWSDAHYEGLSPSNLYDHAHVAAWALTGVFEDPGNLLTATTTMNRSGMAPWENRVLRHVRDGAAAGEERRVLYRVTPVFEGRDLVARGVLIEYASLGDRGLGLRGCAWCYNVRPGFEIDYATGGSRYVGELGKPAGGGLEKAALTAGAGWVGGVAGRVLEALSAARADAAAGAGFYVVAPAAAEFHRPGCPCAPASGERTSADRGALIEAGYRPCESCRP